MKKILYAAIFALTSFSSCTSMLDVESRTAPTTEFLYTSAEGLSRAVVGLYTKQRSFATGTDVMYIVNNLDYCTDLMAFRGGTAASFARLDNLKTDSGEIRGFWEQHYQIIGKANEIIEAAKILGLDNPSIKQSWAEASMFRAWSHFELWKRFERIYIDLVPMTVDNMNDKKYAAATKEEIFLCINEDLKNAMEGLDWTSFYNNQRGRWTKGVVKHIRAQVAMWEGDYEEAITQCEDIFEQTQFFDLEPTIDKIFSGADLSSKEFLYVYQMSNRPGGGSSVSEGVVKGHLLSLNVTPNYKKMPGMMTTIDNGGYGWGRIYPNTYLFSLYDQAKDQRYTKWFKHKYTYNSEVGVMESIASGLLPAGTKVGDDVIMKKDLYIETVHPSSLKYYDFWTNSDNPERTSSFRDLPGYRLAETYLMAAEAYFHKDGGSSVKALEYYNKTWMRAGNDKFMGPLNLDILLAEYARECHFEGVRWPLLKRVGKLEAQVKLYNGDTRATDPNLVSDVAQARTNFRSDRDTRWPIPLLILQDMKDYGQNDGWF